MADQALTRNMETTTLIGPYGIRIDCLRTEIWGDPHAAEKIMRMEAGFDCFVVNHAGPPTDPQDAIIGAIASRVGGWVEVFGDWAEVIHDAIDSESVRLGRQAAVGDGNPMTTWEEESQDSEIALYIWTGGQGESTRKVAVLVGQSHETAAALQALVGHQRAR